MKGWLGAVLALAVAAAALWVAQGLWGGKAALGTGPPQPPPSGGPAAGSWVNLTELRGLLGGGATYGESMYLVSPLPVPVALADLSFANAAAGPYARAASAANLQVAGVDEDDYVKFDGGRLYLSAGGRIYVLDGGLRVLANLSCPGGGPWAPPVVPLRVPVWRPCRLFVWGGRLLAYSTGPVTEVVVYGLEDGRVVARLNFTGAAVGARMVGSVVYIVAVGGLEFRVDGVEVDRGVLLEPGGQTLAVAAVDLASGERRVHVFVGGPVQRIYAKGDMLYVAVPKSVFSYLEEAVARADLPPQLRGRLAGGGLAIYGALQSLDGAELQEAARALSRVPLRTATRLFALKLNGTSVGLAWSAEVPGEVLDQFALEEAGGRLVVATTAQEVRLEVFRPVPAPVGPPLPDVIVSVDGRPVATITPRPPPTPPPPPPRPVVSLRPAGNTSNGVYVLVGGRLVGSLEGIAPGERIYAARLVGDVLYMATFRAVDPIYAVNISSMEVLGFLKAPGFPEYLHPLGGGRLLGVGRYGAGVKVALVDFSRPQAPREVSNVTVSDGWSPALYDHHAFAYAGGTAYVPVYTPAGPRMLAVGVGDGLTLRALLEVEADRAFPAGDRVYLVGPTGVWLYDGQLRPMASLRLSGGPT